jgi:hypothetical protein
MLKIKPLVIVGIFGAFIAIIGWFQLRQSIIVEAQTETPTLTFKVSTRQNSYVLREPIPFDLNLSNQTNIPIRSGSRLSFRDTNFLVLNENGETTRWEISKYSLDGSPSGVIEIPPDKEMVSEELLDEELSEKIFSRPGHYKLRIEYVYDVYTPRREQIKFMSNSITINIRMPQGNDKRAYDYLKDTYEPVRRKGDMEELMPMASI